MSGFIGGTEVLGYVGQGITLTPRHIDEKGKAVSHLLKFDVMVNQWGDESPIVYHISCWGSLAIGMARFIHKGKELLVVLKPRPYKAQVFIPNPAGGAGIPAVANGVPLMVTKWGWEIAGNDWGSVSLRKDADKIAAEEVVKKFRDPNWDKTDEGRRAWAIQREAWKKINFEPGMKNFFYAEVETKFFKPGSRYPVSDAEFNAARGNNSGNTSTVNAPGMGMPGTIIPQYQAAPAMPQAPIYQPAPMSTVLSALPAGITMEQVMAAVAAMTKPVQSTSTIPGMPGMINGATPGTAVANVFGATGAAPTMPGQTNGAVF